MPKNKKRGRPGNEAKAFFSEIHIHAHAHTCHTNGGESGNETTQYVHVGLGIRPGFFLEM